MLGIKKYDSETRTFEIFSREQIVRDPNHYLRELKPDGYIEVYLKKTKKSKDKKLVNRIILHIIDPGVPRYAIKYMIKQYIEFHDAGSWKEYTHTFPSICLILPTTQKMNQLIKYIKKGFEVTFFDIKGMLFLLTTYDKAKEEGLTNGIWQEVEGE